MTDWHTRYRRIIDAYRSRLMQISPKACDEVDDQMYAAGEKWVADQRPIDLDALLSAAEIAERFGLREHDIRNWATRHPDKIPIHRVGRKVRFRVRDVLKHRINQ